MMKLFRCCCICLTLWILTSDGYSQDTLPAFSVKNRFGKIIISWVNEFPDIVQIGIQRSGDSLKGFRTIMTIPDPSSLTNGFLDQKAPDKKSFYRLYVQRGAGKYFFTRSSRPMIDSSVAVRYEIARNNQVTIKRVNGVSANPDGNNLKVPGQVPTFVPSSYVYTNSDGNVTISLMHADSLNYLLKFYKEDDTPLFQMNKVKEGQLTLDKSNFSKSGWFKFELYVNNQLKEKHKFFIPKDQR